MSASPSMPQSRLGSEYSRRGEYPLGGQAVCREAPHRLMDSTCRTRDAIFQRSRRRFLIDFSTPPALCRPRQGEIRIHKVYYGVNVKVILSFFCLVIICVVACFFFVSFLFGERTRCIIAPCRDVSEGSIHESLGYDHFFVSCALSNSRFISRHKVPNKTNEGNSEKVAGARRGQQHACVPVIYIHTSPPAHGHDCFFSFGSAPTE